MSTLLQDVRYALRSFSKATAFTIAAVLTIALGIGANTAIFSVVHSVFFRPLPFRAPDQLVEDLGESLPQSRGIRRSARKDSIVSGRCGVPCAPGRSDTPCS